MAVTIDGTNGINDIVLGSSTPAAATVTTFTSNGIDDNANAVAITIDSSENVGIGTSAPKTRLQSTGGGALNAPSLGNASANAPLYLTNSDSSYGLVVGTNAGTGHVWLQAQRTDGTATAYNITLNEAGGNVGIGTTAPGVMLEVTGAAHFSSHSNLADDNAVLIGTAAKGTAPSGNQGTLGIYSDDAAAAQLQGTITLIGSSTASERRLVIGAIEQGTGYRNITLAESGGNVGIGTTAPGNHKVAIDYGGNAAVTAGSNLALMTGSGSSSRRAVLSLWSTFVTASDTGQRRTADITAGFRVDNWGNEFLDFGVGTGGGNDTGAVTTTRMTITGAGHVTIPGQPAASASYSGADIAAGASVLIPLNGNGITRGGITISGNRFTVPVAGTYVVGYHHLATLTGTQINIKINGASINSGYGAVTQCTLVNQHNNFSAQNLVAMSASDYIEFNVNSGVIHGNVSYNRMYIYLLG